MIFCLLTFHLSWVPNFLALCPRSTFFPVSFYMLSICVVCLLEVVASVPREGLLGILEVLMARQGGPSFTPGPNILLWRIKISPNLVTT